MSTCFYNILKWLGVLPLSRSLVPFDVNLSNSHQCNKYIRNLLPNSIQFKAMRICCKQYYGHIPEGIFKIIEEMIGEMEDNEQKHFLNEYYHQFISNELKRIYWMPTALGFIQMLIIICYSISFLFFLSPFHIIHPMQKLFNFIYALSWILLIIIIIQMIGIGIQVFLFYKTKIYRIRYAFKLSMIHDHDFIIPVMKWCNSLKCDNCSNINCLYLILIEKYGLLCFISIVLILSNDYHSTINYWSINMLSFLKMESLYYRMYTQSDEEDHQYFFMYILFWFFHLFILPIFSIFNIFPKRKMLSLSFRYIMSMILCLLVFLFICYVWYYTLLMPLVYTNIVWLYCMGIVSLFCAGQCIRKYVYYGYYSKYDGDGKEYLKLALQHLGCVFVIDGLYLSIAGVDNNLEVRHCIYVLLHIMSIFSSYLYYLEIQIRLQYKQSGHCFPVDINTYCCGWLTTYHEDVEFLVEESYTDSSNVSLH